jgi:hypothetical protein
MADGIRESVPVDRILIEGTQTWRESIRSDVVDEYAKVFSDLPPIRAYFDGMNYWLSDGFHRLEAAKKLDIKYIQADVFQGDQRAAIMEAVGVNETHGLRRSNEDRRRAVRILLDDEEWRGWANTEIARQCKVSEYFVRTVKSEIGFDEREQDEERPRKTTRKGKEVTVRTKSIGRGREKPPEEPKSPVDEHPHGPIAEDIEEQPTDVTTSIQSKLDGDEIGAAAEALPNTQEEVSPTIEVVTQHDTQPKPSLLDVWDMAEESEREWFVEQRYDALYRMMQLAGRARSDIETQGAIPVDESVKEIQSPVKTQPDLIMSILSAASRPMSREELLEHEGIDKRPLGRNLARLVERGRVAKSDDGRYSLLIEEGEVV